MHRAFLPMDHVGWFGIAAEPARDLRLLKGNLHRPRRGPPDHAELSEDDADLAARTKGLMMSGTTEGTTLRDYLSVVRRRRDDCYAGSESNDEARVR